MSGDADLRRMIARVKKIPQLIQETAPACAQALDQQINASLAAGHGPSGESWAALKVGGAPLRNAPGKAVVTKAVGTTLIAAAQPPYIWHQKGGGKLPKRPVVPTKITPEIANAIKRPLVQAFNQKVK